MFRYRLFSLLPRISLFGALSRKDVDFFIRPLMVRKLEKGEVLLREGDAPGDFFLVLEGEVDLKIRGKQVTTLGEGDLIGADATVGIQQHSVTATARTVCLLMVIPPRAIHRLAKQRPDAFGMLMTNLARDLARRLQGMGRFVDAPRVAERRNRPTDRRHPDSTDRSWPKLGRDLW